MNYILKAQWNYKRRQSCCLTALGLEGRELCSALAIAPLALSKGIYIQGRGRQTLRCYEATFPGTFDKRCLCYVCTVCLMDGALPPSAPTSPLHYKLLYQRLTKEATSELHRKNRRFISPTPPRFVLPRLPTTTPARGPTSSRFNQPKVEGQACSRCVPV